MKKLIQQLFAATNSFDVETTLALFAPDATLKDTSVGADFAGTDGIRRYIETYFVGYNTATRILSIDLVEPRRASVRVDFTGDFGHEIGIFDIAANAAGLIVSVDTELE